MSFPFPFSPHEIATDKLQALLQEHKATDDTEKYHQQVLTLLRDGATLDWAPYTWSPDYTYDEPPNSRFDTLWEYLIRKGDLALITSVLTAIPAVETEGICEPAEQKTVLHTAAELQEEAAVDILPNTPLHVVLLSADKHDRVLAKTILLLKHGADLDIDNLSDETPRNLIEKRFSATRELTLLRDIECSRQREVVWQQKPTRLPCSRFETEVKTVSLFTTMLTYSKTVLYRRDKSIYEVVIACLRDGASLDIAPHRWATGISDIDNIYSSNILLYFYSRHKTATLWKYLFEENKVELCRRILNAVPAIETHGFMDNTCTDTVLHAAFSEEFIDPYDMMEVFLESKKFNINARDHNGTTPLQLASKIKQRDVADPITATAYVTYYKLIKLGADVDIADNTGKTVRRLRADAMRVYAEENGIEAMREIAKDEGMDDDSVATLEHEMEEDNEFDLEHGIEVL